MAEDVIFGTIAEVSRRIETGEVSPVELTRAFLDRIEALDGRLRSYITVAAEAALAQARAAELEIRSGRYRGPLHGIPIGIKDTVETAGIRTTYNSRLKLDHVPAEDAFVVRRLKEAGAVILGKHNCWEFAHGDSLDVPFAPPRNPWHCDRDPGGSSSGSAVAVAAGMCMGAVGGDAGGSIRWPAALTGVAGLKPSFGLVSRRGAGARYDKMSHIGPLAWTSADCALMLAAMAGHDPWDFDSANIAIPSFAIRPATDLAGITVGVVRHFFENDVPADPEVGGAVEAALAILRGLGAKVRDVVLSPIQDYNSAGVLILRSETFAVHEATLLAEPAAYGETTRHRKMIGGLIRAVDYVHARRRRRELMIEVDRQLVECDVLLTPGAAAPAPPLSGVDKWFNFKQPLYTMPFNVTGHPAISICCGFSSSGLPLGLQLVGGRFQESDLLSIANAYEKVTPWRSRRPSL